MSSQNYFRHFSAQAQYFSPIFCEILRMSVFHIFIHSGAYFVHCILRKFDFSFLLRCTLTHSIFALLQDSDFELSNLAQSGSSFGTGSATSSSASESKSGARVFESGPQTTPAPEKRTPPTAPKIESLDGDEDESTPSVNSSNSRPQAASQQAQQPQNDGSGAAAPSASLTLMQSAVVAGNLAVLFFSVVAVISGSSSPFRFALLSAMLNNAISLYQIFGVRPSMAPRLFRTNSCLTRSNFQVPKFNMEYFRLMSKNDNWQYIFYCFVFLTGHPMPCTSWARMPHDCASSKLNFSICNASQ
jgi:hypothetical protein